MNRSRVSRPGLVLLPGVPPGFPGGSCEIEEGSASLQKEARCRFRTTALRNARFRLPITSPYESNQPPLCHLDRSVPEFPTSTLSITATYAALRKESRTYLTDDTTLHRKSGGAQWRDLQSRPTPKPISPTATPLPLCHLDRSVPEFPTSPLSITATYAALRKESRTYFTDDTTVHRKSGGAQWRDLRFRSTPKPSPLPQTLYPFVISTGA